jgi:hypothetical protein
VCQSGRVLHSAGGWGADGSGGDRFQSVGRGLLKLAGWSTSWITGAARESAEWAKLGASGRLYTGQRVASSGSIAKFFAEVMVHPIPVDIEGVKIFASAPGAWDLFVRLAYPCFVAKGEEWIPLFGEYGLTAQLGSVECARPRRFRAMLEEWLEPVQAFWPECPATISEYREYSQ